jgi:hypothetical protein
MVWSVMTRSKLWGVLRKAARASGLLERRIRGGVHESLEDLEARGLDRGRRATAVGLGRHIAGGAIVGEEVTDTTQTESEARCKLPQRALVVLVSLPHPGPYISGIGTHRELR